MKLPGPFVEFPCPESTPHLFPVLTFPSLSFPSRPNSEAPSKLRLDQVHMGQQGSFSIYNWPLNRNELKPGECVSPPGYQEKKIKALLPRTRAISLHTHEGTSFLPGVEEGENLMGDFIWIKPFLKIGNSTFSRR